MTYEEIIQTLRNCARWDRGHADTYRAQGAEHDAEYRQGCADTWDAAADLLEKERPA